MKTEKLSLKSIKNVLSRAELKKIMAGGSAGPCSCCGPGGYNYCYCYLYGFSSPALIGEACGNGNCNTYCISEGCNYGTQQPCAQQWKC